MDGYPNQAEVIVGKALAGRRSDAVIAGTPSNLSSSCSAPHSSRRCAGKFGAHAGVSEKQYSEADVIEALDLSLKALGTDCMDMYQVHWRGNMKSAHETIRALDAAKRLGKLRHFGVCNFGPNDLGEFVALAKEMGGGLPTNQVP